jgi:integrase
LEFLFWKTSSSNREGANIPPEEDREKTCMTKKYPWAPLWSAEKNGWVADFRVGGKRVRKVLEIRDPDMKLEAIEQAKTLYRNAWRDEGTSSSEGTTVTFAEAARLYVQQGGEERFLPRILKHFGSRLSVDEITHIDIARAARLLYPDAKPETVRRQLRVPIKAVQNFAAGRRREKLPDTRRTRWLTPEEAERLLDAAAHPERIGLRDPHLQTLRKIAFMLGTGAGPGETMSAQGKDWNPATREWWLSGTKTVYRARFVRLPSRSVDLIGRIPETGPAFPAPNGLPYTFSKNHGGQMASAFNKVRDAAGFESDVVPYSCRHSWATWSFQQTKNWGALLDQGGWNRADTANRYRKIAPSDLGNRLLAHGWDFREDEDAPVRFGELVTVGREGA